MRNPSGRRFWPAHMDGHRSPYGSAAAKRYEAWRADAFHSLIAYEARQRASARRLRLAIKLGGLGGLVIGVAALIAQML